MRKTREHWIELAITIVLFILVNALSQAWQRPLSFNHGQGWDGVSYVSVAQQLANNTRPVSEAPFVYRLGTPLLVSVFFKSDLLLGFKVINLLANILTALLFLVWLRLYLRDWRIRVLLLALFFLMWHGPVRFVYFYSASTDNWLFAVLLAGLIGIRRVQERPALARIALLGLLAFIGAVFRETTLIIPVALLAATNPVIFSPELLPALASFNFGRAIRRIPLAFLFPIGLGALGFLAIWMSASQNNAYSFADAAVRWAYRKPLLTYLQGWFGAFGPMLVLLAFNWRRLFHFLATQQFMLVCLLGFAVLAWIGGSDTERILFWGAPVVFLLIGKAIEDNAAVLESLPLRTVFLASQLISERVFWTTPDYPNRFHSAVPVLTIPSGNCQYLDLLSYYSSRRIEAIAFLEYALLSILLLWWMGYRKANRAPLEISSQ